MRKIFFVFLLLFLPTFMLASQTITTIKCKGYGVTRNDAIQNALIEALKQTKGVSIDSRKEFAKKIQQKNESINQNNSRKIAIHSLSQSNIKEATRGLIDNYRIIDDRKISSNEWRVILLVKILGYRSPGLSTKNRRKIAIMPFYYTKKYFNIGSEKYSGSKISYILTQSLTSDLTQTRKFAVVDRTYLQDMSKELGIIASGQTPLSQRVKLGQKLGADYLLVGTIREATIHTTHSKNQLLGTMSLQKYAEFIIDYRIIVVATSQIKWSDTKKLSVQLSNTQNSLELLLNQAIESIAHTITNELLANIYPIRIVKVSKNGTIILNQGANSLKIGEKMNVMRLGEKIVDPYTKESLGRVETKVAMIQISNVTAKMSYAKIISGSLTEIKSNDICRRVEKNSLNVNNNIVEENDLSWKKSSVKVEENGGVKLPFD